MASMTASIKGLAALHERQLESIISASGLVGGVLLAIGRITKKFRCTDSHILRGVGRIWVRT